MCTCSSPRRYRVPHRQRCSHGNHSRTHPKTLSSRSRKHTSPHPYSGEEAGQGIYSKLPEPSCRRHHELRLVGPTRWDLPWVASPSLLRSQMQAYSQLLCERGSIHLPLPEMRDTQLSLPRENVPPFFLQDECRIRRSAPRVCSGST